MRVARIGLTPVKGARHQSLESLELAPEGPVGDRVFCLVDRARGRVLRTVEHPTLVQAVARWEAGVLSVDLPGRTVEGVPTPTGETLQVDYWGRTALVGQVSGPWAEAFSEHLGEDVVLARVERPGEVVYGASVTVLTTASLDLLSERVGREVDSARFRSTLLVQDAGAPHEEDTWVGRELRVGQARLRVRGTVPRCAVVDIDPATGARDVRVLKALGGYRQTERDVHFGVDAVVVAPGDVRVGESVELERG